jgi:hypothetical protein
MSGAVFRCETQSGEEFGDQLAELEQSPQPADDRLATVLVRRRLKK